MSPRKGDKLDLTFSKEEKVEEEVEEVSQDLFEFKCTRREQDDDGNWHYFVSPVDEYDDLDFQGHEVLINGTPRRCEDFYFDDDDHVVIVSKNG